MAFFLEYFPELAEGYELKGPIKFATWLHEPGYPRYTPELSDAKEIMENCEALAYHWGASQIPVLANVLYLSEEAKSWPVFQKLYFLDCCFNAPFSDKHVVIELGTTLQLWSSTNTEVMFRWSQVLIKNQVTTKLETFVGEFLQLQGKQKFQIPLYRLLTASPNPEVRAFASKIYALTKPSLHVMVRDRIEILLHAMTS